MCMCVGPVSVILVVGTAVQCETVHGVMPAPRACKKFHSHAFSIALHSLAVMHSVLLLGYCRCSDCSTLFCGWQTLHYLQQRWLSEGMLQVIIQTLINNYVQLLMPLSRCGMVSVIDVCLHFAMLTVDKW